MTNGYLIRVVNGTSTGASASVDVPVVVGREGDLAVADPTVSRLHARADAAEAGVRFTDLRSSGGIAIAGVRCESAVVGAGETIALGGTEVLVLRLVRYSDAAVGPALRVRDRGKDRVVTIRDGMIIGRDPDCDICIDHPTVSRRHAVVRTNAGRVQLDDQGSANGTRVNGQPVRGTVTLVDGAAVEIGRAPARLAFSEGAATGSVPIRVTIEATSRSESLTVDAAPATTVAQVTRELARAVDAADREMLLYRLEDGALLHPDDQWWATGVRPGDEYVLGIGDATAFTAAPGRHWPERSVAVLNQLPRTVWPEPAHVVDRLDPPESTSFRGRGIMWQIAGGMGAIAIGLTLVLVNPDYAVFGVITGGIGIVSIVASIMGEQSRRRHRVKEFRAKLADLDAALGRSRIRQATALHALSPTVDDMTAWLAESSPRIWERRPADPDALRPTIGTGRRAARIDVDQARRTDSPLVAELEAVLARHTELERVPVTGPGPDTGSFGITGSADQVRSLVARIVVEAAILHPAHQLRIWLAASGPGWEWCRWLPHIAGRGPTDDPGGAADLLAAAERELDDRRGSTDVLHLVVIPDPPRRMAIDARSITANGRTLLVVTGADRRDLPSGLGAVLDIDPHGAGTTIGHYPDAPIGEIAVASIDDRLAERIAVELGRLGGRTTGNAPSGLVELLGLGSATHPDVLGSWSRPTADRLTVAVGSDDTGSPVTVGFRRDGPHGMIAGTTGSGKSELLQTVLTALALHNAPDRLNLFLVDFKGGSTFAPLASLPHVVGLVTDLEHDTSLATRALTALDAEIERRKRVLDAARVPDVIAYERTAGDSAQPLPDLLVVIDEFALLMERQPDVRDRLDTIATQGRSLGVHLLLATQSPSGVITHAIRTNTNLWICLRVVTESESTEILGTRDAARIPDQSPGRAIIRLGAGQDLRTFQAARIARPVPDEESPVRVTRRGGSGPAVAAPSGGHRTELDLVVEHIRAAATELGLPPATPLWLPPLPTALPAAAVELSERPADRLVALVGLADHPRHHLQEPCTFDLSASGHALVAGVFGFGKSTALTQIASDLAHHMAPDAVHIYAIDSGSGSLSAINAFPHVGDVVGAGEIERVTRLIDRLTRTVDARREQLATAGSGDFLRWRAAGGRAPWIVLLVDDYPSFREMAEQVEMGRLLERFNSILQNGPAVGIHVVVATAQATDLRSREINLMLARLLLRAADSSQYSLVDARFSTTGAPSPPPGRGLTNGAVEVQVCEPQLDDAAAIEERWASIDRTLLARPVRRLPHTVSRTEVTTAGTDLLLGLGGPDVEPVGLAAGRGPIVLLVAGPSQSGRSTTLVGLLASLRPDPSRLLVVSPRPGPLRDVAQAQGWPVHIGTNGVDQALDEFAERAPTHRVLVIDDAEAISSAPGVGHRLEQVLRDAPETDTTVLVAARVSDLPGMFDPWARYLMSLRRVVLLQPTVDDAFLFGTKLPVIPPPAVPGRGIVIDRNGATVVQVAVEGGAG